MVWWKRFAGRLLLAVIIWTASFAFGSVLPRPRAAPAGAAPSLPAGAAAIFSINARVAATAALGLVTCGLSSIMVLLANGMLSGFIWAGFRAGGAGPIEILKWIVPHGPFELGGLFLAAALGLMGLRRFKVQPAIEVMAASAALTVIGAFLEAWEIAAL